MYLLPGETRVSDPCPRHQDQRGRNPGSERAGATAAAPTISEPAAQRKPGPSTDDVKDAIRAAREVNDAAARILEAEILSPW